MAGTNRLALLFLLTITILLESCVTNANYYKDHIPKFPKKPECAQNNQTALKYRFLTAHNLARKKLGIPSLVWDEKVANYSRWYAAQRRWDCKLVHSHGQYGENLFWGSGNCWTVQKIVQAWVVERHSYDYNSNTCKNVCGHYTQIVWRKTKKLGCAVVVCAGDLGTLAVCNYDPPGNYVGMLPY